MEIIALADIHGSLDFLKNAKEEISSADLILIAGDITNFGGRKKTKAIIKSLREYNSSILAVSGNCDSPEVGGYLAEKGMNINANPVEFMGLSFAGLAGGSDESQPRLGDTLEEHFTNTLTGIEKKTAGSDPLILVTHQPPSGTSVESRGGGSDAIYDFIKRRQPILAVSGHIHEAYGKDTIGNCILVNPGSFREGSYAKIELEDSKVKKVRICTV